MLGVFIIYTSAFPLTTICCDIIKRKPQYIGVFKDMAIDFPTLPNFVTSSFRLEHNTRIFLSPISKDEQRQGQTGGRWVATYALPSMNRTLASAWQSFFAQLEGKAETFNAKDPERLSPLGIGTGETPLVNGASQTGKTLITDGWTINQTGLLLQGDLFSVNGELKIITSDVDSDSGGNATINFSPALRASPANNDLLTVDNTTIEMRLNLDDIGFRVNQNSIYQPLTFTATESFFSV